jgi:asparagine synthase (glutamine-hydrolysing)
MCGINISYGQKKADRDAVNRMNEAIAHRGLPGNTATYVDKNISLGHVRLPIQGLSDEFRQPYRYKQWIFAFVGEIFNFKKLYSDAKSDVQVLAWHWAKKGLDAFNDFDGFWSVAIYNIQTGKTVLAIDDLSKKPLYSDREGHISSEIKGITCLRKYDEADQNKLYYARVRKFGYDITGQTFDRWITKLVPGCYEINQSGMGLTHLIPPRPSQKVLAAALLESVENRLVSDISVGILVSGGIDSTIIYELAKSFSRNLTLFHVDNGEEGFLNDLKIPPDIKLIKLSYGKQNISEALYYNEGPVDLGSMLPQFALGREIKKHDIHVVLSGDGADELFGGYMRSLQYDSQESDIIDELVHYHLPRLDKLMMASTIELRCPFLSRDVVGNALVLPWTERQDKKILRTTFKELVPKSILERPKMPLRIKEVWEDKEEWRHYLVDKFQNEVAGRFYEHK